jgi:hypothetical protein
LIEEAADAAQSPRPKAKAELVPVLFRGRKNLESLKCGHFSRVFDGTRVALFQRANA